MHRPRSPATLDLTATAADIARDGLDRPADTYATALALLAGASTAWAAHAVLSDAARRIITAALEGSDAHDRHAA